MPLLAFALTYGSFGDIKETFGMACRLYKILHDRGGSSNEIQKVLDTLKSYGHDIVALMSFLQTNYPPEAQQFVNNILAELEWCHSHMDKLHARLVNQGILARIWLALSEEKELASWRDQMADHRTVLSGQLQLLLGALCIDGRQQVQRMGSHVQDIGSGVERVRSEVGREVRDTGSQITATTARQISDAKSDIVQQFTQLMNLHHISVPMFSVLDPLGQPIPITLRDCHNFQDLDDILKFFIRKRPGAGTPYVERGDYNLFLPEGTIVRRVDFSRTVKPGMELDMSIIKRPRFPNAPDLEKCPYCNEENPKTTGNEWIHCSNHQCGRQYQISAKEAEEMEEIYSPQLLTERDETQAQQEEDMDLFRLVEIQATYEVFMIPLQILVPFIPPDLNDLLKNPNIRFDPVTKRVFWSADVCTSLQPVVILHPTAALSSPTPTTPTTSPSPTR